jgi:hypothetical protein
MGELDGRVGWERENRIDMDGMDERREGVMDIIIWVCETKYIVSCSYHDQDFMLTRQNGVE